MIVAWLTVIFVGLLDWGVHAEPGESSRKRVRFHFHWMVDSIPLTGGLTLSMEFESAIANGVGL